MPLSRLNKEQYEAATAPLGHNLIIASAGTGKTSTIVARIAHLLKKGVNPNKILLLTFTNKAANEMLERVENFFDKKIVKQIESGTFHAVSYRLLKSLNKNIVLKQPKELKLLLKAIYANRRFDHIDTSIKPYQATYLYDIFSLYQNSEITLSFTEWLKKNESEHTPFFDIYEDVLEEFKSQKEKFGYVDFNDLLMFMKKELESDNSINFSEILVDEYQDTNTLQNSLIDSFKSDSLFCVGDYDQSIYAFNGADINIIGSFGDRYKNAKIFTLNKNYRSSEIILALANKVIEKNPRLYPKQLEVTRVGNFDTPVLLAYNELFEQYKDIAKRVDSSKALKKDIAVIFRNNSSADGIEACLREFGISCKRKGGISFFDSREVKVILDIATIFANPKDMMAFIHIFEYAKGIGSALSKEIFDMLYKLGDSNIVKGIVDPNEDVEIFKKHRQNRDLGLFGNEFEVGSVSRFSKLGFSDEFLSNPILKHSKINEDSAKFLYNFYQFLIENKRVKNSSTLVEKIVNSNLFDSISEILSRKRATLKDDSVDSKLFDEAKERIIRKGILLRDLAKNYNDLDRFLNALTLGSSEMSEGDGVNLLSVHASKGLEFDEVYIIDLMDGRFPNRKLMNMGGNIEEERRLFYVATTRAKNRLFFSYSSYDKIKKMNYIASPFLTEAGLKF